MSQLLESNNDSLNSLFGDNSNITDLDLNSLTKTIYSDATGTASTIDTDLGKALKELGFNEEEMTSLLSSIKEANERGFCARMAYPFLTAITKCSSDIYSTLKYRDYDTLNALTGYIQDGGK